MQYLLSPPPSAREVGNDDTPISLRYWRPQMGPRKLADVPPSGA
jgi:hypothetical protein